MGNWCGECAKRIMCEIWAPSTNPEPPLLVDGRCPICNGNQALELGDLAGAWDQLFNSPAPNRMAPRDPSVIVLDEKYVVLHMRKFIQGMGYEALGTDSSKEAVLLLSQNREHVQVVLLDPMMPGINAADLFAQFRAIKADLHITLISVYAEEDVWEDLRHLKYDGFLEKPFLMSELADLLKMNIKKSRGTW